MPGLPDRCLCCEQRKALVVYLYASVNIGRNALKVQNGAPKRCLEKTMSTFLRGRQRGSLHPARGVSARQSLTVRDLQVHLRSTPDDPPFCPSTRVDEVLRGSD